MSQDLSVMPRPRLHRRGLIYEIVETIILILSLYALADLASVRFFVDGPSMEPSFVTGQRVIVSRVNYMLGDPQRGDIIVFQSPDRPGIDPPLIKRVIGLPGDTVEIRDSRVFVNGQELNETYTNGACVSRCNNLEEQLRSDEFFVMGDNRDHSRDSRAFGPIKRETVIGEALVRYWEPQDWTLLHQFRYPDNPFK